RSGAWDLQNGAGSGNPRAKKIGISLPPTAVRRGLLPDYNVIRKQPRAKFIRASGRFRASLLARRLRGVAAGDAAEGGARHEPGARRVVVVEQAAHHLA